MSCPQFSPTTGPQRLGLLLCAVFLVVAPHAFNLATSIMAFFCLSLAWRCAVLYRKTPPPPRTLLFLMTLVGAGLVFAEYHRFYGREAGASLFVVGLGLKLLELKTIRDAYLVVFLAFFVAVTQYLFSQSIAMAAYTLAVVVILVAALISLNCGDSFPIKARFRLAGLMVAQAIPIMIVLFFLFPRISGPLWKLPEDSATRKTGLSDVIEPGSIGRLGLSQEPAFRVDFEGTPPPPNQRYWRGPVFWRTDGQRWTLISERVPAAKPRWTGQPYRYTVTLEPHNQRWVYALDLPASFPAQVTQTGEYLLTARDAIAERRQYAITSYTGYSTGSLSEREKSLGLELPSMPSSRLTDLVEGWQAQAATPEELVARALRHFREEPFFYTLNPPLTPDNPVESFLFETRRGFCEHYATTFVVLMRIAGIPARVVTGYQGGQWNPLGRFLEVKQADAHAWAEVWFSGSGWTRIDPTAAVAPERIERGVDVDTQIAAGEIRFNPVGGALADQALQLQDFLRRSRMVWASIDHSWHRWVLSYGAEKQTRFLQRLGIIDWRSLALWLAGTLALIVAGISLLILPKRRRKTDRALAIYTSFLRKMARQGWSKEPSEGALAFARRIGPQVPEAEKGIHRITTLFLKIRYGRASTSEDIKTLERLVRTLRL
jgi:transglutaminase-like putative cysteine protease